MSHVFPISGTVMAPSTETPGPASGITYTVWYSDKQGRAVTKEGITPAFNRWPDTIDTIPAPEGTRISGYGITIGKDTEHYIHIPEFPKTAPCPGQGTGPGGGEDRRRRRVFVPGTTPPGDGDGGEGDGGPGGHGGTAGGVGGGGSAGGATR